MSSRVQFVISAESLQAIGVSVVDVDCAAGVPSVTEGAGVEVTASTIGDGVSVGTGDGVGCGLQAERINTIDPIN